MENLMQEQYYDKVYGGWLGKCIGGAAGAPVEGIKKLIPGNYKEFMRADLPNDDLDLQLLWLEVMQEKGIGVTARDMAQAWEEKCWYPFNEYGYFLKNYERGIMPPYSGSFNNHLFAEGEGCPIRSEIWGMLFPGEPEKASHYAEMDGSLDHTGEAVWIEKYFAAIESRAFMENDIEKLLKEELIYLPEGSRARMCVEEILEYPKDGQDSWKKARKLMLRRYGHHDFTNAVTNLGITVIALLYGKEDLDQIIQIAFSSGFDTDCTCATAAAIWGIAKGANAIPEELKNLVQDEFVIGINVQRKDNSIRTLAAETCELGKRLRQETVPKKDLSIEIHYYDRPAIGMGDTCRIGVCIKNHTEKEKKCEVSIEGIPENWSMKIEDKIVLLKAGQTKEAEVLISSDKYGVLNNVNIFKVRVNDQEQSFGVAGAAEWYAVGPFFENLEKDDPEGIPSAHGEGCNLPTLECMVNNAVYLDKAYMNEQDFAQSFREEEPFLIHSYEDLIPLDKTFPFRGQGCVYLRQTVLSERDEKVWVVLGNNDGFRLWINNKPCMEKDEIRLWTPYNNYQLVQLHKGENEIVLKILKRTEHMKFSFGFRKYEGEHFHRKKWCLDLPCVCDGMEEEK